jgi:putative membrane protein
MNWENIIKKAGVTTMRSKLQSIAGAVAALVLVLGGMSVARGQQNAPASADQKFVESAAKGGMLEVALANQAASKSNNADVKNFANHLIQDHSKGNQELAQLAQKDGLPMPSAMGSDEEKKLQKFSSLNGQDFDRAFIRHEIKDHKQDIKEFSKEAKNGTNPDLKDYASKTVPQLQQHLSMAESVGKKIGASRSAKSWWEFWKRA